MNKLLGLGAFAAATLVAPLALPCGAPFGAGVNVDPHQDIIVAHKAGTETYVFQPTFCGEAKDFGLILPVPAILSSAPELSDEAAFAAAIDLSKPNVVKQTKCIDRGLDGVGGAADAGFGGSGTTVVASGHVGFLDWTQLKADSETSFTAWLDANGYTYDPAAKTAFASYVTKGWYFLAFKINQGAPTSANKCRALGPVKLSFPSDKPVIPSRIATAGQTIKDTGYPYGFSWRVFGVSEAGQQIDFASGGSTYSQKLGFSGALTAEQAGKLAGLAAAGDRLTRLTLWFDGSATDDVALTKKAAADFRETTYDTTYVECDAGVPIDDAGPGDDAGTVDNRATSAGGAGCSTSARGGGSFALLAIGLAALLRRARR